DRRAVGEQPADGGVVALYELRGRLASARLETHEVEPLACGQPDVDETAARPERLGDVVQGARTDERHGGVARRGGGPGELAQREAVAVGRQEGDALALDLDADA